MPSVLYFTFLYRQSIYRLPELDDFELSERTHIQGVIEKAEKRAVPFVIKITNVDTIKEASVDVAENVNPDELLQTAEERNEILEKLLPAEEDQQQDNEQGAVNKIKLGITVSLPNYPEKLGAASSGYLHYLQDTTAAEQLEERSDQGAMVSENIVKELEQEAEVISRNAENIQATDTNEKTSCQLTEAELEHIRKVTEAAAMMGANIQWTNWMASSHAFAESSKNGEATDMFTELVKNEKILEKSEIERESSRSTSGPETVPEVCFEAASVSEREGEQSEIGGRALEEMTHTEAVEEQGEELEAACAKSMAKAKMVQETSVTKLKMLQDTNVAEDGSMHNVEVTDTKAVQDTELVETWPIQHREHLATDLTEEEMMHIREVQERARQFERLSTIPEETRMSREEREVQKNSGEDVQILAIQERKKELEGLNDYAMERAKISKDRAEQRDDLTEEEIMQIRSVDERVEQLDKSDMFDMEARMATVRVEQKNISLTEEEMMQIRAVEERAKQFEGFGTFDMKQTRIFTDEMEWKDTGLTEEEIMQIRAVEERAKQLEDLSLRAVMKEERAVNGQVVQKVADLTEKEVMQIRAVEERAKQLERLGNAFVEEPMTTMDQVGQKDINLTGKEIMQIRAVEEQPEQLKGLDPFDMKKSKLAADQMGEGSVNLTEDEMLHIRAVEERSKQLDGLDTSSVGEARLIQDTAEQALGLTEEEMKHIRAVEERAKWLEQINSAKEPICVVDNEYIAAKRPLMGKPALDEGLEFDLTEEELKHITEVERRAVDRSELPQIVEPTTERDPVSVGDISDQGAAMAEETDHFNRIQKRSALGQAALHRFTNIFDPLNRALKESKIIASPFNIDSKNDNVQGSGEEKLTVAELKHIRHIEALAAMEASNAKQTVEDYLERQYPEASGSSSGSSEFGPGASDESEADTQSTIGSSQEQLDAEHSEFEDEVAWKESESVVNNHDTGVEKVGLVLEHILLSPTKPAAMSDTTMDMFIATDVHDVKQIPDTTPYPAVTDKTQITELPEGGDYQSASGGTPIDELSTPFPAAADYLNDDRFAGLTAEEIEHIRMIDRQFELENVQDKLRTRGQNIEISKTSDFKNYAVESVDGDKLKTETNELTDGRDEIPVDLVGLGRIQMQFLDDTDSRKSAEDIEDTVEDTKETDLAHRSASPDSGEDRSQEERRALERKVQSRKAYAMRDDSVKSLEELGREADIAKWYEERLSSLRSSLCAEEIVDTTAGTVLR